MESSHVKETFVFWQTSEKPLVHSGSVRKMILARTRVFFSRDYPSRASRNSPNGKKMAAVRLTTIPCEPNIANRHIERHCYYYYFIYLFIYFFFCEICSCTNNVVYARFEVFETSLCFYKCFLASCMLRIMVKCTSRHFFLYSR